MNTINITREENEKYGLGLPHFLVPFINNIFISRRVTEIQTIPGFKFGHTMINGVSVDLMFDKRIDAWKVWA